MSRYKPEWSNHVLDFVREDGTTERISLLDVKSFAAKAVRDGDEAAALRWMWILYDQGAKVWKQLLVRSVEDIGMADLCVMDHVYALKHRLWNRLERIGDIYDEIKDSKRSEWLCIILATMIVCRARKNRATDDAAIWFRENPTWNPPVAQEVFDAAKLVEKDFEQGTLPLLAADGKVWDKHTARGRKMKRGEEHFKQIASKLKNEADVQGFTAPIIGQSKE